MNIDNLKILYIEDEDSIRAFNTIMIKKLSPNTISVSNAADGIKEYKNFSPDVIITDIDMPGISGLDLIKRVRENDDKTRVLITTAYTNKDYLFKAIELRLTKYLEKPIEEKDLQEALTQCIKELKKLEHNNSDIVLGKGYIYNKDSQTLLKDGVIVVLKRRETLLLDLLVKNIESTVDYKTIDINVWEEKEMTSNALRSIIKDLRKKLDSTMLINVSGLGYKLTKI